MFACPTCNRPLEKIKAEGRGSYLRCPEHGQLLSYAFIRSFKGAEKLYRSLFEMRTRPLSQSADKPIPCPKCSVLMSITPLAAGTDTRVDQCLRCHEIWFDQGELSNAANKGDLDELFPRLEIRSDSGDRGSYAWPSQELKHPLISETPQISSLPMMLGLPAEEEQTVPRRAPFVTLGLIVLSGVMTAAATRTSLAKWAFFPEDPTRSHGLTLFTSLLVQANLVFWAIHAYFLYLVGDNIEDDQGPEFLIALFLTAGLGGHLLSVLKGVTQPTLGASAALFGLITYYALAFPKNKIHLTIWVRDYRRSGGFEFMQGEQRGLRWDPRYAPKRPLYTWIPAWAFFGAFILLQVLLAQVSADGMIFGMSYLENLGGAAIGFLFFMVRDLTALPRRPI